MPNVMSIDLRANTERARDDVKATLTEAAKAAREFRNEMYALRDAQLRAREAVTSTREAFHQTQTDILKARDALKSYHAELQKASQEQSRLAAERAKLTAQVEKAQKAYDAARKGMAFSGFSGAETTQSRAALDTLTKYKVQLESVSKAHQSASGSVGYYRRQVKQTDQDIASMTTTLKTHGLNLRKATDDSARLATTKSALSNKISENRDHMTDLNGTMRAHEQAIRADDAATRELTDTGMAGAIIGAALMDRALRATWNTLKDLIVQSTLYAGRTVELQVALENVGRIQGYNVGQLRALENAIKSLGITTQDARNTLIQFAATGLNLKQAPQLARVAQDLAVVAGVDTSEEVNRLVAGIETLQIRALRTAGVFVSLEGEMRKAANTSHRSVQSFSEQEKQQILLNAVLDYGARATGTYDQAMSTASKQMRTMNRLTAEMNNAIGELFQGPFGIAISVLSTFLKIVTAAPGAFVLFAGALTLFVGKVAYSTLANAEWAASFRTVAATIIDATRSTLGLSAAQARLAATTAASSTSNLAGAATTRASMLASGTGIGGVGGALPVGIAARSTLGLAGAEGGTAAAAGLSATGWGLIAVAIGAATYGLIKYLNAEQDVTFANQENLRTMQRQIQVNTDDAKSFRERANAIRQSGNELMMSDEQRKTASREEAMALLRLDPLQRQAADNDANRAAQLDKLASGLDRVNEKLRTQLRELNKMTVANLDNSAAQIDRLLKKADEGRVRNNAYNSSSPAAFLNEWGESIGGLIGLSEGSYGGNTGSQQVMEDSAKAQGAIEARRNALQGLAEQEREIRLRTHQSTDAILAQEFGVKKGTKAYEEVLAAVSNYTHEQENNNGVVREAQDLYNQMTRNLEQMKLAQFDVTITTEGMSKQQENLQGILTGALALGMNWQTAIGGAQSAIRAYDDDIMRTSESQAEYNKRVAGLSPELQKAIYDTNASSKAFEHYGEAAGKVAKRLLEMKNGIREAVAEMSALQSGSGELAGLQTVDYAVKRELDARRRLQEGELERYGNVSEQPISAEEVDASTRRIQGQLDVIKGAREAIFRLERMEVEGSIQQFQVMQQQNELLDDNTRQYERQMTVATTFLKMQQSRIDQEKQLTAEIAARIRLDAEEGENRKRGIGRDRIAYLEAVGARQKLVEDIRGGLETIRAETQLRRDLLPGGGGAQIGEFSYTKRFDTPDPTKRDLAVVNLMTQEQKQLHEIAQNTFATAENTALIAENGGGSGGSGVSGNFTGNTDSLVTTLRQAILGQESSYNYRVVNPHSGAVGFSQVMPANIPSWSKEALGTSMTPEQFRNDPKAQIAITDYMLGKFLRSQMDVTGGDTNTAIRRVASQWYSGNPALLDSTKRQFTKGTEYPSISQYTNSILQKVLNGSDVSIDPEETKKRNEVNSRIMRGYKLPVPTERPLGGTKGDVGDSEYVVSVYTELIEFAKKLQTDAGSAFSDFRENLKSVLEAGTADAQVAAQIFNAVKDRYAAITATYRELVVQRTLDASGFQESEENRLHIYMNVELARRKAAEDTKNKIIQTQREIEEVNIGSADRIRLAYLESAKAQARASEDALTRIAQDIPKLEAARHLNMDEVNASITDWLAQQKSVSQVYADSVTNLMNNTFGAIDNLLGRLSKRTGIFGSFISDLFGGLLKAGLTQVFSGIFSGGIDKVKSIITGQAGDAAVGAVKSTDSIKDAANAVLGIGDGKTIGRMEIQSAGQIIINSTGNSGVGSSIAATIGSATGLPAPVTQAISRGLIPSAGGGGGVFNIGQNGIISDATGNPIGTLPSLGTRGIGMGSGAIVNGASARNSALANIFGMGGGAATTFPGGAVPGGTPPFAGGNMDIGALLAGGIGGASAGVGSPAQAQRNGIGGIFSSLLSGAKGFFGQNLGGGKLGGIFGTKATGGTFGFGNSQFAAMLPLLGAQFGGMLGGSSKLGSILGTAGGALAGIGLMGAPAILTGTGALAGSLGFLAPLFSNPITAIVGGALLIGAVLLGRNAKRRQEEKQRTQILGDAKTQLQKILSDVQHDRMDGASAVAAAEQVRQQYLDSVGQLKDKKTRNIAIATVRELDYFIGQIKTAATQQERRKELNSQLVPEFAGGGVASSAYSYGQGRGGVVSGVDMGHDTVLARLRPREVVMNMQQQRRAVAMYGGDVFRNIGVPGFSGGGSYAPSPTVSATKSTSRKEGTTVILVADEKYAHDLARQTGGEVIKMSAASIKNQDGPLYREIRKMG